MINNKCLECPEKTSLVSAEATLQCSPEITSFEMHLYSKETQRHYHVTTRVDEHPFGFFIDNLAEGEVYYGRLMLYREGKLLIDTIPIFFKAEKHLKLDLYQIAYEWTLKEPVILLNEEIKTISFAPLKKPELYRSHSTFINQRLVGKSFFGFFVDKPYLFMNRPDLVKEQVGLIINANPTLLYYRGRHLKSIFGHSGIDHILRTEIDGKELKACLGEMSNPIQLRAQVLSVDEDFDKYSQWLYEIRKTTEERNKENKAVVLKDDKGYYVVKNLYAVEVRPQCEELFGSLCSNFSKLEVRSLFIQYARLKPFEAVVTKSFGK